MLKPFATVADAYRKRELPDPELRARATPDYEIGCKRILFSSDWYAALRRDNVELLNGAVQRATPSGVVGADGVERDADTSSGEPASTPRGSPHRWTSSA